MIEAVIVAMVVAAFACVGVALCLLGWVISGWFE